MCLTEEINVTVYIALLGDMIVIHHKEEDGWWYGAINGKKGIFPATYVEELIPSAGKSLIVDEETSL